MLYFIFCSLAGATSFSISFDSMALLFLISINDDGAKAWRLNGPAFERFALAGRAEVAPVKGPAMYLGMIETLRFDGDGR